MNKLQKLAAENDKAKLKIKGSVAGFENEGNNTNYKIPTSEKNGDSTLSKTASSNLSYLNCEVEISN